MRVLKIDELKETPMDTATPIAGWTGAGGESDVASDYRRRSVGKFSLQRRQFPVGATTGWHVHDCDQILVVTAGKGMLRPKLKSETFPSVMSCTSEPERSTGTAPRRRHRCRTSR